MTSKLLVAYSMTSTHVQTTRDYLEAVQRCSGCDTAYLHVTHDARIEFDFAGFDIVFHSYCARLVFDDYVSGSYREALRRFDGLKVLAVQDEYDATDKLKAAIRELGFHIVLTCVPQASLAQIYPPAAFPGVTFITVLTGYVPDDFAGRAPPSQPLAERPIAVGYRGRDLGPAYGRLGREKYEIGERMGAACRRLGIGCDITMDERNRIYGPAWLAFIGSCRSMLGSESGSNVFDFDGQIRRQLVEMTKAAGRPPTPEEFQPVIGGREALIDMGQISPRIFECAVMRTPMILLRGRYSGAIEPDVHYIPLEKDYANADAVLARLDDHEVLAAMAERAYQHLVASGRYGYRQFWATLAPTLAARLATLPRAAAPAASPDAGGALTAENGRVKPRHPLSELPTTAPKTMADYRRQIALVNRHELGRAAGGLWTALTSYMPGHLKVRFGRRLKLALDARQQGRSGGPADTLYLALWRVLPAFVKARLDGSLKHIDYASHERK